MVMMVVLAIIIGLMFFMVVVMRWEVGAIEVLCLIVFVGFAVDYCLHVAHKYHTCHINSVTEQEPASTEKEESADAASGSDAQCHSGSSSGIASSQIVSFARDSKIKSRT